MSLPRDHKKGRRSYHFHCTGQTLNLFTLWLYVTMRLSMWIGCKFQHSQSSSVTVSFDAPGTAISTMKSLYNIYVSVVFCRASISSNAITSIANDLDCAFKWTFPDLENVAVLQQNIPADLSYNPRY